MTEEDIKSFLLDLVNRNCISVHEWKNTVDRMSFREHKLRDAAIKDTEKELMQEIGYYPSYYLKSPVDIKINSIKAMFKRLREAEK